MLLVVRELYTENAVAGKMYLNGQFICYTLENAKKVIPVGEYTLQNSVSPKFKKELPLVFNETVAQNRGIRIHEGNTYASSSGCLLVGMGFDSKKVALTESKLASQMVTMLARNVKSLLIVSKQ